MRRIRVLFVFFVLGISVSTFNYAMIVKVMRNNPPYTETEWQYRYQSVRLVQFSPNQKVLAQCLWVVPRCKPAKEKNELPIIIGEISGQRAKDGKYDEAAYENMSKVVEYVLFQLSDRRETCAYITKDVRDIIKNIKLRFMYAQTAIAKAASYVVFFSQTKKDVEILIADNAINQKDERIKYRFTFCPKASDLTEDLIAE